MCKKIIINIISLYFILVPLFCFAIEYNEELFNNNVNTAQQKLSPVEQQMYNQWFSSKEQYENNLVKPLTTGTTLYTLDRQKSYNDAQIMCPGSENFIEVFIQPGPTKDLNFIQIKYDSNLDGTYDGSYYEPGPISGICANGIIKCRAGTWDACKYYKWKFDGHSLYKEEVNPDDLGGCYCINSYCTSASFWNFKDQVLTSIGGGIAAAMSEVNPDLGISSSKIDGYYIQYFAQNTGACSYSIPGQLQSEGITNPEDITPGQLEALTAQEQESQANNEDSIYYLLTHSKAYTSDKTQQCEKIRIVNFNSNECNVESYVVDNCAELENNPNCRLRYEKVYDAYNNGVITYKEFNPTGLHLLGKSCKNVEISSNCIISPGANGGNSFNTNFFPCPGEENCFVFNAGKIGNNYWSGWCTIYETYQDFYIMNPDLIRQATIIRAKWDDYMQIYFNNDIVWCGPDHCSDPNNLPSSGVSCERSTSWDKILNLDVTDYFKNNNKLRIKIKVEVAGGGEGYAYIKILYNPQQEYCYDWWKIERIYECEETQSEEQPDLTRIEYVDNTIQETSTGIKYDDIMQINNQWQLFPNQKIDFKTRQQDVCIRSCKVIKNIDPAEVGAGDYTSADYRHDPSHIQYIYRTCIDDVCPLEEGEEMVEPCSCINEFNRVVSIGETIKLSTIDMICSSGQKIE